MKIFITKYALTSGIYEQEVNREEARLGYVRVKLPNCSWEQNIYSKDYSRTESEAFKKAEQMRILKTEQLKLKIEKLKKKEIKIHRLEDSRKTETK